MNLSKSKFVTALGALTCAAGLGIAAVGAGPSKLRWSDAAPRAGTVTRESFVQRITVTGYVVPRRRTMVTSPYTGYIKKLWVQVGDDVKVGAPLVSITQSLLGDADPAYPLRAAFAGRVVQVLLSDGESVEQKQKIVRIDDLSRLSVVTDIPETDIGKLKLGQEAVVTPNSAFGREFTGKVKEISLAAKESEDWRVNSRVEFPVQIELNEVHAELRPGMSASVEVIVFKKESALTLRHEFVQRAGGRYFAVLEDGEKREIKVGMRSENVFEILEGVKEGDRVRQVDILEGLDL